MQKKDTQQKSTLTEVLTKNQSLLCDMSLFSIWRKFGQTMLTNKHLEVLMKGLRDYITNQDRLVVEQTINSLKEQLNFDVYAVHQLLFSLYFFRDAVRLIFVSSILNGLKM